MATRTGRRTVMAAIWAESEPAFPHVRVGVPGGGLSGRVSEVLSRQAAGAHTSWSRVVWSSTRLAQLTADQSAGSALKPDAEAGSRPNLAAVGCSASTKYQPRPSTFPS